ncbi:hypothetical protein [Maridesulfovibrio sp.]|uniref:hypothetical protein n=1 Tax=Maridesulfovibrio sp. TaxID=2795000 RepID=UPI002A189609|nr:hypothetical protein [Maridesulfovibrio sp.]
MVDIPLSTPQDERNRVMENRPELGRYLGASMTEAFEDTTLAVAMDETRIANAERDAYGASSSSFWGPNPYDPVTQHSEWMQHRSTQKQLPYMSEADWQKSEHYREGIKWEETMTPVRAGIYAEEYDKRKERTSIMERGGGGARSVLGFGAGIVGSLPDPVNFIPFGGAVRGGSTMARVGAAVFEGAASTALADAVVMPNRAKMGKDVGLADYMSDVFFGAAVGGLFGFGGAKLHDMRVAKLRRQSDALTRQKVAEAADKAIDDLINDRPVDVSNILKEVEELGRGYDRVLADPVGDPGEVLATLEPEDLEKILVERGPSMFNEDGNLVVKHKKFAREYKSRGWGLVKIIWRHGEESGKQADLKVRKEDILSLPHVVREYDPAVQHKNNITWTVAREDGAHVVYVAKKRKGNPDQTLVSTFVDKTGSYSLSKRKTSRVSQSMATEGSLSPAGDTPAKTSHSSKQGREVSEGQSLPKGDDLNGDTNAGIPDRPTQPDLNKEITTDTHKVNLKTETIEPIKPLEVPDYKADAFETMGIDAKSGKSQEEIELDRLIAEGRVSEEDLLELDSAKDLEAKVADMEEAGLGVVECVLGVPDAE